MASRLTANGVAAVAAGNLELRPVVQATEVRSISGKQERFCVVVSDGAKAMEALLATQLTPLVKSGRLRVGSIIQLLEYVCNTVGGRVLIIVLNMEILVMESEIIGNPKVLNEAATVGQNSSFSTNGGLAKSEPVVRQSGYGFASNSRANAMTNPSSSKVASFNATAQPPYKPPPHFKSHGAILKNEAPARIIPIAAVNPYQGRWAIKARVTSKSELRRYNNAKGDGKVFSFDLLDSDGGEIRATCFNAVVDRFYHVVEVGKVYIVSKGSLKPAQKDFNHLNNQWEIFLEAKSTLDLCLEEDSSIPAQQFNFKSINEIEYMENNSIVDMIGIVASVNPSITIVRKNGMETQRRIINLKDMSGRSVELTLWGEFCNREGRQLQEIADAGAFAVVAVKAAKVSDFSGKSIGSISSTQIFINPDFPEAQSLIEWFNGEGKNLATESISRDVMPVFSRKIRKTVAQIKDESLGRGDKPDWITVKAIVTFIKTDNFFYTACPLILGDRQCSKKVTRLDTGKWCCDRCDREFDECDFRYLLQAQIQDHTGLTWVTAFQESGEEILGCPAKELYLLKENDDVRFGDIIRRCLFEQYFFKLKVKEEHYGEEQQVKVTVVKADKLNPSIESKYLLDLISQCSLQDSTYYTRD